MTNKVNPLFDDEKADKPTRSINIIPNTESGGWTVIYAGVGVSNYARSSLKDYYIIHDDKRMAVPGPMWQDILNYLLGKEE